MTTLHRQQLGPDRRPAAAPRNFADGKFGPCIDESNWKPLDDAVNGTDYPRNREDKNAG
jgi:hypothetical protein